jgi:hypothetical protein
MVNKICTKCKRELPATHEYFSKYSNNTTMSKSMVFRPSCKKCDNEALRNRRKKYLTGNRPWNKGLTKDTDIRLKYIGDKISNSMRGKESWCKNKKGIHSHDAILKLSNQMKINKDCKYYKYNSKYAGLVRLQGTYELGFAKILDLLCDRNLFKTWIKNTKRFKYIAIDNNEHYYTPDFEVIDIKDNNIFFETKGYTQLNDVKKIGTMAEKYGLITYILEYKNLQFLAKRYFNTSFEEFRKL